MQSLIWTGRNVSRALINGICARTNNSAAEQRPKHEPHLVSAICGFPKQFRTKKKTTAKGQIGDDAYFAVRHKTVDVLGNTEMQPFRPPKSKNRLVFAAEIKLFTI